MPNLKEVLEDRKTFPDELKYTSANGIEMTLGEMRNFTQERQNALSERQKQIEDKFKEVTELATTAAEVKNKLDAQLAEAAKGGSRGTPSGDEDFDTDPFWAPASKRFKPITETMTKLQETVQKLAGAVAKSATIWAEDRWESQFRTLQPRLGKVDKYKDWTYEKVRDYAAENKIIDRHGFPSVEKAILELTKDADIDERIRQAKEEGLREGMTRGRLASATRPTSATGPKRPEKSVVAEKGLEGLGDDVANDPELAKMLAELGAVGPEDLVQ